MGISPDGKSLRVVWQPYPIHGYYKVYFAKFPDTYVYGEKNKETYEELLRQLRHDLCEYGQEIAGMVKHRCFGYKKATQTN